MKQNNLTLFQIIIIILLIIFHYNKITCKDILTQIQFGKDDSTIKSPIVKAEERIIQIKFKESYSEIPTVLTYITYISITKTLLQNYKVTPTSITKDGFQLIYLTQFNGQTISMQVSWMAFEKNNDLAEVIYQEINGNYIKDPKLIGTSRNDIFTINFKNTYLNPPNISLFLLGLSSLESSVDAIGLGYTDITTSQFQLAVSTWSQGLYDKVSLVALVVKKEMSISQYGKQSNLISGQIDKNAVWIDTTKTNRIVVQTQTSQSKINSEENQYDGSVISSITGFRGYDVRLNLITNLKINLAEYQNQVFKQTVETWGMSQIVAGYWDSVAINTTTNSLSSLEDSSGFAWWLILIIFLVVLICIIALILLIVYCDRKRKRNQANAAKAEQDKLANKQKEDDGIRIDNLDDNNNNEKGNKIDEINLDFKKQDQSRLQSKINLDNTKSILIQNNNQQQDLSITNINESGYPHNNNNNQHQTTKRDPDASFIANNNINNNTQTYNPLFVSPKNLTTDNLQVNNNNNSSNNNNFQNSPHLYDQSSRIFIIQNQQKNNNNINNNNNNNKLNEENMNGYYRSPQKQNENINKKDESKLQETSDSINMYYQSLDNQSIPLENKKNNNIPIQNSNNNNKSNQQNSSQPIDKTIQEVEQHLNNYNNNNQNQQPQQQQQQQQQQKSQDQNNNSNNNNKNNNVNQSMLSQSQDMDQNDEMKSIKRTNYDIYRQIVQSKYQFDKQHKDISESSPYIQEKNNNNSNIINNHILNSSKYNIDPSFSNNSTYRPLQQSQRNNNDISNRNHMSQIGKMIVSGNHDFNKQNSIQFSPSQQQLSQQQQQSLSQPSIQNKDNVLKTAETFYKFENSQPSQTIPLYQKQRDSQIISQEDDDQYQDDDIPRRPKNNNQIPHM